MNFYHVYTGKSSVETEVIQECKPPRLLLSYHYFKRKTIDEVRELLGYDFDYLYDSGAFSARTQGINLDLQHYINKIKTEGIQNYLNVDVFNDNAASFENFLIMREADLNPIPVIHADNYDEYLSSYVESGCNVIAIGGTVPNRNKREVADYVRSFTWQYPNVDFHLLGSTCPIIINTCNIASCDSSSWIMKAAFGKPRHMPGTDREAKKARAIYNLQQELAIQRALDKSR